MGKSFKDDLLDELRNEMKHLVERIMNEKTIDKERFILAEIYYGKRKVYLGLGGKCDEVWNGKTWEAV